ncbi:hypothetical protein [Wenyingzhuangia sp. IMCC45574]
MKENKFASKFESKTNEELKYIVENKHQYDSKAVDAAFQILEHRNYDIHYPEEKKVEVKGEENYNDFIKTINKKTVFAFTPKYSEEFTTMIPKELICEIALRAFERLEWDVVFYDKNIVEAKRSDKVDNWSEKIVVSVLSIGKVCVESISLGSSMLDGGKNSKRVKLFIHVYKEIEAEHDKEKIEILKKEVNKRNNWDDYEVPKTLPLPTILKEPKIILPIVFGVLSAIILGGLFAVITRFIYFVFLFEIGLGVVLAYILSQGIKLGNYTNYISARVIMGLSVIGIVVLNQYIQYLIIMYENSISIFDLPFIRFMEIRLEEGFVLKNTNLGWIGWIGVIVLQLVVVYYVAWLRLVYYIVEFQLKRVPEEVVEFAMYHFVKGKRETEVKRELSLKGWSDTKAQEYVMEALSAVEGQRELRRA